MKKYFWLLMAGIAISSLARAQETTLGDKTARVAYPNILEMKFTPTKQNNQAVSFSDLGAWHGITIPAKGQLGIGGPYLVADHRWAGASLAELILTDSKGNDLLSNATADNIFYPGLIAQSRSTATLAVHLNTFYISNRTTIVSAKIANTGNAPQNVTLGWKGECFGKSGSLSAMNHGIGMRTGSGSIQIRFDNHKLTSTNISDTSYTVSQIPRKIKPGQTLTVSITLTYLPHGEQLSTSESNLIGVALNSPTNLLAQNEARWNTYIKSTVRPNLKKWNTIAVKSIITLTSNWKSALADLPYDGVIPSIAVNYFDGFWAWDSWKHSVGIVSFNPALAKNQIRAMFSYQDSSGMVIDCIYPKKAENNSRDSKPPLAAWAVWEVFNNTHDTSFIKEMLPKLERYHKWWYTHRDHNKNGLCEFGSTDGTLEAAGWESGMDNAVRFDSSIMIQNSPHAWSLNQESVDLNSFLYLEKQYLEKMCLLLKEGKQAMKYGAEAKTLRDSIRVAFWHEPTGYFYDRIINTDSLIMEQGSEGWHPLWAGVATKEQVDKVAAVMLDSSKFNTFIPFPTLAIDNPKFDPNGYWRGPVWLDQVYFAIEGLRRNGYSTQADILTKRLFTNLDGISNTAPIHENYQPANGKGIKAPNFSWSAAHLLMLYSQYGSKQ